jgi:hypothetical protein
MWVLDYEDASLPELSREAFGQSRYYGAMRLGNHRQTVPAVAFATDVGRRIVGKNSEDTFLQVDGGNPRGGYLLREAYFRRPAGDCHVFVTLSAASRVIVEIRDASRGVPIESTPYRNPGVHRLDMPISFPYTGGDDLFDGYWPFISPAWRSTPYDALEVRVWAPPHSRARVLSVGVTGKELPQV